MCVLSINVACLKSFSKITFTLIWHFLTTNSVSIGTCQHIYDQEKKEIEQRICWPKPKINLYIPLASKNAKCVVLGRLMYWTPPGSDHWTPLSKSYDLFREPRDIGPPL